MRHPVIGAGSLCVVVISTMMVPGGPDSTTFMERFLPGSRATHCYVGPSLLVVRDDQMHVICVDRTSWDPAGKVLDERPQDAKWAYVRPWSHESGFWAPTRRTHTIVMHLSDAGANSTPWAAEEDAAARAAVAKWVASPEGWRDPIAAAALLRGGVIEDRVLWGGVVLDAVTLIAFVALIWSATGLPAYVRNLRVNERLARGICPRCRYDLSAAPSDDRTIRCPECGSDWPRFPTDGFDEVRAADDGPVAVGGAQRNPRNEFASDE